jgi:hypothetical protein
MDPDSIKSVDPDLESGSGSRRAKMTHKKETIQKCYILKCWMFFFES